MKDILYVSGVVMLIMVFGFVLDFISLESTRFTEIHRADVTRDILEAKQTGNPDSIKDLDKLYIEYQKAESMEDKAVIKAYIQLRYRAFNMDKIDSQKIKAWLIEMRKSQ